MNSDCQGPFDVSFVSDPVIRITVDDPDDFFIRSAFEHTLVWLLPGTLIHPAIQINGNLSHLD